MKLLHIDSSIRGAQSVSRTLTAEIVKCQKALHPGIEVIYRDLAAEPALHLSHEHVAAWSGGGVVGAALCSDLETGQEYLSELFEADILVMGAPMYNFSVPSQLKAWIDRIVVEGQTFEYSESGELRRFLPSGKKIIVVSTCGNVYPVGAPTAAHEHHESYLRSVFNFLGFHDVTVVRAEGLALDREARDASIRQARFEIAAIAV
jgi:FMN-dependent NADH-azoreductase